MDTPLISLRNVSRYYRQGFSRTHVLRDVSLDIEAGAFVSIMGPSGSGKSTLLNIVGMLDEPSDGTYFFMGRPVMELKESERVALHRNQIGFVFQAYHLIDDLTVYENLETPLIYQKVRGGERKARVADMLDRFGIVAKRDLFPHQLSGGQQQLVGIARALIIRPKLILADEPTGNLQSAQGADVMGMLRDLNAEDGVTVVHVTHSMQWAEYGRRIVHLLDGRVEREEAVAAPPAP